MNFSVQPSIPIWTETNGNGRKRNGILTLSQTTQNDPGSSKITSELTSDENSTFAHFWPAHETNLDKNDQNEMKFWLWLKRLRMTQGAQKSPRNWPRMKIQLFTTFAKASKNLEKMKIETFRSPTDNPRFKPPWGQLWFYLKIYCFSNCSNRF